MKIILYTIDCPKCKILKKKLDELNIEYDVVEDVDIMLKLGMSQVPILENQISFIKSTFFEDTSYMASFFDSPENKLQRKFNISPEG